MKRYFYLCTRITFYSFVSYGYYSYFHMGNTTSFISVQVPDNGDCLFSAFLRQLTPQPLVVSWNFRWLMVALIAIHHEKLFTRTAASDVISSLLEKLDNLVVDPSKPIPVERTFPVASTMSFRYYLLRMLEPTCYGDNFIIACMAKLFGLKISLLMADRSPPTHFRHEGPTCNANMVIVHNGQPNGHYTATGNKKNFLYFTKHY